MPDTMDFRAYLKLQIDMHLDMMKALTYRIEDPHIGFIEMFKTHRRFNKLNRDVGVLINMMEEVDKNVDAKN